MIETTPKKPKLFYGWVIVAGVWVMYALNQAAFTWGFSVFVGPLSQSFGWSRTSITMAWALSLGWGLMVSPWFGRAFDRFGPRLLTATGGLLGGLGWLLLPTVNSYWLFLFYMVFLIGTGINGAIGISGSAAISQWFRRRRSLAMGVYFTGSGGAGLLLIPALGSIVDRQGWQPGAITLGIVILVCSLIITPFMRHRPEQYGLQVDGGMVQSSPYSTRRWALLYRLPLPKHVSSEVREYWLGEALHTAAFWVFACAIFLRYVGMGITQVHQVPHMQAQGVTLATATGILSLSLVVNIPSRVVIGWMGDVYSKKWLLHLLALAGGIALLALALLEDSSGWLLWVYAVFWGLGLAMLPLQASWLADAYGRKHYGSISSFSNSLTLSGRIFGALGAAILFDLLGSYRLVLLLGAGGFLVGALLLALLPSRGH